MPGNTVVMTLTIKILISSQLNINYVTIGTPFGRAAIWHNRFHRETRIQKWGLEWLPKCSCCPVFQVFSCAQVKSVLILFCCSDDLKRIIGSETTRKGLMCVFEMFQHENLNRRLVLVLFEGILQELFPDNHFEQIFQKLHSKSTRIPESEKKANNWPPYLYKFLGIDKSCPKSPSKSPIHRRKKPNHS